MTKQKNQSLTQEESPYLLGLQPRIAIVLTKSALSQDVHREQFSNHGLCSACDANPF